jgi:hypothetical protein
MLDNVISLFSFIFIYIDISFEFLEIFIRSHDRFSCLFVSNFVEFFLDKLIKTQLKTF